MNRPPINFCGLAGVFVWLIGVGLLFGQNTTTFQVNTGSLTTTISVNHQAPAAAGDTDNDGLPDAWELQYFGHLGGTPAADDDSDGTTNLQEFQADTNPVVPELDSADGDGDGLPDAWELRYCGTTEFGPDDGFDEMDRTLLGYYQHGLVPRWRQPAVNAGLRAWYVTGVLIRNDPASSGVVQWCDLSGNGFHLRPLDPQNQPEFNTGGENPARFVTFADGNRLDSLPVDILAGAGDWTMLITFRTDSLPASESIPFKFGSGSSISFRFGRWGLDNDYALTWPRVQDQAVQGSLVTAPMPTSAARQITVLKQGAAQSIFMNGILANTGNVSADFQALPGVLSVGGDGSFSGGIYEIQIYNRALSTPEREDAEDAQLARHRLADGDRNGLSDRWEQKHFGHTGVDSNEDADGDGMNNLAESQANTDPHNSDSDGDGLADGQEIAFGSDPTVPDANPVTHITWLSQSRARIQIGDEFGPDIAAMLTGLDGEYDVLFKKVDITHIVSGRHEGNGTSRLTAQFASRTGGIDPFMFSPTASYTIEASGPIYQGAPYTPELFYWHWNTFGGLARQFLYGAIVNGGTIATDHVAYTAEGDYMVNDVTYHQTDTIDVRMSEEAPYVLTTPAHENIFIDGWSHDMPFATLQHGNSNGVAQVSSVTSDYQIFVPPGANGTIHWLEIFAPASDPTHPQITARQWVITGQKSPMFTLTAPSDGVVSVIPAPELAVDANRDGEIKFTGETLVDTTSSAMPYRFWLNDDIDRLHVVDDTDYEQDDIGGTEAENLHPDWKSNDILCQRDLEDFFRFQISTKGLVNQLKNGKLFLGFKWIDVSSGAPALKLFKHVDTEGDLKYLTDESVASDHINTQHRAIPDVRDNAPSSFITRTVIEGNGAFILPSAVFSDLSENDAKTYLLVEACKAGSGHIKMVILKKDGDNYTEIGEGPGVWMDLKEIGDMYEHWSVGNGNGDAPMSVAGRVASESGSGSAFSYSVSSPEERKYILFVHGWNMEKWEKERFAETAFKRLWWQGYKGRAGLFSWPTTNNFVSEMDAILDSTNFDRGEFNAWRSAPPLRQLMQALHSAYSGELYVLSHSMGGIVASEALRLQSDAGGGQIARVYVASQAALSAHTYDGTLTATTGSTDGLQWDYNHPQIPSAQNYGPHTANIYKNWMAFMLSGSAVSSSSVGTLVNFYNENDWALAAPAWQFNQITKPDFADYPSLLWEYAYEGDPEGAPLSDGFRKYGRYTNPTPLAVLGLGNRTTLTDRYEIMAFAAESRVKALGATSNISQGISRAVNLQSSSIWPADADNHSAHKWHSAEFRSTIQLQRNYWKTLLSDQAFDLSTKTLP